MDMAYSQAEYANEGFDQSYEDFKRYMAGAGDVVGLSIRIPF
jgi:hypothetical protein